MKNGQLKAHTFSRLNFRPFLCLGLFSLIQISSFAQAVTASAKKETSTMFSNPLFWALAIVIVLLAIIIVVFTELIKAAAHIRMDKNKDKKTDMSTVLKTLLMLCMFGLFSDSLMAQAAVAEVVEKAPESIWGLNKYVFYIMMVIIGLELIASTMLYIMAMQLLGVSERKRQVAAELAKQHIKPVTLIEKLNASVALEKEADIMLDHNYDGIKELDNDLPPWWKYGFYFTIIFAVFYMAYFHISGSGKLQLAEYEDQLAQGKLDVENYRKKAANLVDENNVTELTDVASLEAGKLIFVSSCSACHGAAGEGTVGPNLTDDYWLHKGGIKDIFKSVKFGWPEKGMKSWQQDLSSRQIHEVSSYIRTLHGTNPPKGKEKQGELYTEETTSDTTAITVQDTALLIQKGK